MMITLIAGRDRQWLYLRMYANRLLRLEPAL
jgi:hypothetical protein